VSLTAAELASALEPMWELILEAVQVATLESVRVAAPEAMPICRRAGGQVPSWMTGRG